MDTIARVNEIFQRVFEDDQLIVTRDTSAKDIDGWDSLRHVSLMVAIERAFKLRFSSKEVASLKNVGELLDLIEARQKG
jgi:acyl carrier protein